MTPSQQQLLEVDVSVSRLVAALGTTVRAASARRHLAELRRIIGRVQLADLVAHADQVDPEQLLRQAVISATQAGLDWSAVVAIVNTASERRGTNA